MPKAWKKMLGPDWELIQDKWLHRLGNLTLTGYNPKYSDRSFEKKKSMKNGFESSAVRLNKFVREQQIWTPDQMRERANELSCLALKIWKKPTVPIDWIIEAKRSKLLKQAQGRSVENVPMTDAVRSLFNFVRRVIMDIEPKIIEIPAAKSVSYHTEHYIMEVLPRKYWILLLLAAEYGEMDNEKGIANGLEEWRFFPGSRYGGRTTVKISNDSQIEDAIPLIKQALYITR